MPKYDYDMIVIGAGAAGLTASTFAGQSSAKTLLIEKEKKLGGDCLHYGCVPSKTLIKSAYAYHVIRNASKYGLPDIEAPKVNFKDVARRIKGVIDTIQEHDEPDYLADKYNVETSFGEAVFVDNHTIMLNGQKITSRFFVLATGSSPFIPPIKGITDVPYITNIDIFSLEKLPTSLIVLGGGPIGLEMAQAFNRLGSKVTVVQSGGQILPKEDRDVADYVKERLSDEGVEIILNGRATQAKGSEGQIEVTVESQDGETSVLHGEKLLVSTGRRPNVLGLDLEKAGVQYSENGVQVNRKMQTTAGNIYACGDVTGGLLFTHIASYEAVVAVYNAILKIPKTADYRQTPWVTYLDPEIASIGFNERRAKEAGLDYTVHTESFEHNDRALAEGENKGYIKIILAKGKVIGVQIISYHAGDLIAEWIPVLNGRLKLSTLTESIHPYPTMAEMNKNASVNYMVSTIPNWTKKLTKFLFRYQGKV